MASVYQRKDKWYLRYRDRYGHWCDRVSTARTKTEAKRLATKYERHCERQRLGLEPIAPTDGGGTLGELLAWWLLTYSEGTGSHRRNESCISNAPGRVGPREAPARRGHLGSSRVLPAGEVARKARRPSTTCVASCCLRSIWRVVPDATRDPTRSPT